MMRTVKIGDATLIHGDAREVLPTLGRVDAVVTDPPYETEAHTLQRRINRGATRGGDRDVVSREELPFAAIGERDRNVVALELGRVSRGWVLVFCQVEAVANWRAALEGGGAKYRRAMIWVKPDGMLQYSGDRPGMGYETIVSAWAGRGRSEWNGGGRHGVFTMSKRDPGMGSAKNPHPTTKPLRLMTELVDLFSNKRKTILDPFMGSGTTGVAALQLGRKFIGIEIDRKYFDIAVKRVREAYKALQ